MKDKDLEIFFKVFSNLYGAILDKDAIKIIQKFFPEYTYEEFRSYLKKKIRKPNRSYVIRRWNDQEYVIKGELSNKEVRHLFMLQNDKPFFVSDSYEEYKQYVFYANINKHTNGILRNIAKLCIKYVNYFDEEFAKTLAFALAEDSRTYVLKKIHPQDVLIHLKEVNGIEFSFEDRSEYLRLYNQLDLETRTQIDRGHTRREINEVYIYEKMFRPVLNSCENTVFSSIVVDNIELNLLYQMIDNARTFTNEEKDNLKEIFYKRLNDNAINITI